MKQHKNPFKWRHFEPTGILLCVRRYCTYQLSCRDLDETYVKVGTERKYLYGAIDSTGRTMEFMLGASRDVSAAKRFFKKMVSADFPGRKLTRRLPTYRHTLRAVAKP